MSDVEFDLNDELIIDDIFSDEDFLDDNIDNESDSIEGESDNESINSDIIDERIIDDDTFNIEVQDDDIKCLTIPRLTKYEKTNIIGIRATQIQSGSKPFININKLSVITPITIAEEELRQHKLDFFKIKRTLPSGKIEIIGLKHF